LWTWLSFLFFLLYFFLEPSRVLLFSLGPSCVHIFFSIAMSLL
jgi:hypothetical protein